MQQEQKTHREVINQLMVKRKPVHSFYGLFVNGLFEKGIRLEKFGTP